MALAHEKLELAGSDQKYVVVRNALHPELCKLLANTMYIIKEAKYHLDKSSPLDLDIYADSQIRTNCFSTYGAPANEALLLTVQPIVERVWGRDMYPTYSFARIYWRGAALEKHTDRAACEYSVSTCIDVSGGEPWPIWFGGDEVTLNPGDLVTYRGMEVEHWRDPCPCRQQVQIFLHYVAQDGPHADQKFDRRRRLALKTLE